MIIDPISQMKYRDWTWKYVWVYPVWNWRRQWHPTQVLLPGKSHGRRSLVGCSPWGREESDTTERLQFHFSLSCIGEENGNPLQCSCLENPRVGGAWWAAIYGVAQSQRRLKRLSSSSSVKWNEGGASYVRNVVIPRASEWWDLSRERDNLSNFKISDQIRSVAQSCPTLCNPMNRSTPGLPVHHQLPEFTQTHVHRVSDAIQPSHPLSSPSLPAPNPSQHQSLFQWVNSLHEVAKVLECQL